MVSHRCRTFDGGFPDSKGIFHARLPDNPASFLLENVGYTFGFIIVIMARQQLFTENTVTPVLPIMQKPSLRNFILLFRLWGLVLLGNLIGTGLAAYSFIHMPVFDEDTRTRGHGKLTGRDVRQWDILWLDNCHDGMDDTLG
ncbi:Inner membrane protein yfdC [Yersinia aldovae ATCC 35236]|nr:Inner membrane protein yfdC [Yersinia aldovae ATCC 35236]